MNEISLCADEIISKDLDNYGDMLLRLSFSYMKNIHDAEDVVQEVFFHQKMVLKKREYMK